ncbi:MAG TPA: hypothetical protein VGF75_02120, partial [Candidatus Saccharimonadales bacterium]
APSILVSRIQTELNYLPEGSQYHGAKGVGSFILDSLCAVADAKGWRVYLTPLERDGRLMGSDLNDWYARRGFKFRYEVETQQKHLLDGNMPEMMRLPQPPDPSQPVEQALAA